jgi:hypothetical protein
MSCPVRKDGGWGVGFIAGHFRINWKNDEFRKLVLNTLFGISKVDVPLEWVSSTVTVEDNVDNLDSKGKK